jgi:two-component system, OmpR family, sensor kinase
MDHQSAAPMSDQTAASSVSSKSWFNMFGLSLILTLGTAATLAIASILLIVFSPAPFDFPVNTFEIARTLKGESIVREDGAPMRITVMRDLPQGEMSNDQLTSTFRAAILRQLQVPETNFSFTFKQTHQWFGDSVNLAQKQYETKALASAAIYGQDPNFSLLIFRAFRAGLRQPDGTWRVLSMEAPGPRWQRSLAMWIFLMLLLVVPIAWMFSRRLAQPIREFSLAAERIGHGNFEQVQVRGPGEIRLAAKALNDMQARLQQLIRERTTMIAAIAHDLRTPLARLSFLLADAPDSTKDRAQAQLVELDQMIAGTLDFVRHETMQLQRERIDLRALLESILDDHIDLGHNVALTRGTAVMLQADPQVLKRLFANLIDNALKYGFQALVTVRSETTHAVVSIADLGPGISDADRKRVFEPFFRGEPSRNRATGGAGLGLSIVQSAIRAHRGEIDLINAESGGLVVHVRLPIADSTTSS